MKVNKYIVSVVFRCEINSKDTGSRDFKAILVKAQNEEEAIKKIFKNRIEKYKNTDGEWVKWILIDMFSISKFSKLNKDMEEIASFIAEKKELYGKTSLINPKLSYLMRGQRSVV